MSAFNPIAPRRAADIVEAAGLGESAKVLVDFATAGLLKGYARLIETVDAAGDRTEVRDSRIPRDLWRRVAEADKGGDLGISGSVRLSASSAQPAVDIIRIRFDDKTLQLVVDQHNNVPRQLPKAARKKAVAKVTAPLPAAGDQAGSTGTDAAATAVTAGRPSVPPIPRGAVLATVNQAMATLGLGRTKVNELMKSGRLVRRTIDGGVRIEVASIYAFTGNSPHDGGAEG